MSGEVLKRQSYPTIVRCVFCRGEDTKVVVAYVRALPTLVFDASIETLFNIFIVFLYSLFYVCGTVFLGVIMGILSQLILAVFSTLFLDILEMFFRI